MYSTEVLAGLITRAGFIFKRYGFSLVRSLTVKEKKRKEWSKIDKMWNWVWKCIILVEIKEVAYRKTWK